MTAYTLKDCLAVGFCPLGLRAGTYAGVQYSLR